MQPRAELLARGRAWRAALGRAVVLAASTREGEEEPLLRAWSSLPAPRPLLLLVPRHPQRFDEVAHLVVASGLFGLRRSGWRELPPPEAHAADVWLGDTVGEMAQYYGCADAALLGGSFAKLGGQNLIEAAACGCPVVMGPHTFNFAEAAQGARAAGAALRVRDMLHGVQLAVDLVYAENCARMSEQALAFAVQHRGAALRMARAIVGLLPPAEPAMAQPGGAAATAAGGLPAASAAPPVRRGPAPHVVRGPAAG
jgi:3-deoxy-D-manno-octulosonic-acid transferase